MVMCSMPGCIAQALPDGQHCYVHAHKLGVPCTACASTGSRAEYDEHGRLIRRHPCDRCGGTGLKDRHHGTPHEKPVAVSERGLIKAAEED